MTHLFQFGLTFLLFSAWYTNPSKKILLVLSSFAMGWFCVETINELGVTKELSIHLGIDFLLLGIHLLILQAFKHLKGSYILAIGLLFSLVYAHKIVMDRLELNPADVPEILIHFESEDAKVRILKKYEKYISKKEEIAFDLQSKEVTDLDDYLTLDIKNNYDPYKILRLIKDNKGVEWIELNQKIEIPEMIEVPFKNTSKIDGFSDPLSNQQWNLNVLSVDKMHAKLKSKKPKNKNQVLIAILDTGIDSNHEDIKAHYKSSGIKSYDSDSKGHGTHCAGIAGAVTGNKVGVASIIPEHLDIKIMSIQVLNNFGFGTQQSIIAGILKAADLSADVISLSLGGMSSETKEKAYTKAVEYANKKGAIVVVAAGNSNKNARYYSPANTPGVIAVTSIDSTLKKSTFANTVDDLEMGVAAPGENILSTYPDNLYKKFNGTSMAAPYVAGLIAVLNVYEPDLDTKRAYELLQNNKINVLGLSGVPVVNPNDIIDQLDH